MTSDKATLHSSTIPCAHCGLPAPQALSDEPAFCCIGCEAIYHAIHSGGFDTFYKLREMGQTTVGQRAQINSSARPGNASDDFDTDGKNFINFDSAEFLEQHSTQLADGSRSIDLHLEGVHCAGCVWLTERLPHVVPGVMDANLSLARARLKLRWHPEHTELSTVAQWLTRYGYMPHALHSDRISGHSKAERAMLMRVGASWAIAGNIMILAVCMYGGLNLITDPKLATFARYISLGLATISLTYGGGVFFRRAAASLRGILTRSEGFAWSRLSMDVPIALGVFVGWAHSAYATITGQGDVWFDSIAVLIAALLTARWLQMRGQRFAGDAAERLLSLLPSTARRLLPVAPDGQKSGIEEVPADTLQIGDLVEVRAGDVIPADGIITHGLSNVHRAVVTGESRPEPVTPGDPIEAGVTNLGAVLTVRVTAAGSETRVGKLMQWVEDGERRRAPIVQLADHLGGLFVLVVLASAALTALVWSFIDPSQAVAHVVALLVISCPCALGMATPLALTVGVGRAAKHGFFIKHDDVLQALARATHIIFDKTGTLTEGRMTVAHITGDTQSVHAAARLEAHSAHPIAAALTTWAAPLNYTSNAPAHAPATDITEVPGSGITGFIDDIPTAVGHIDWILTLTQTAENHSHPPNENIEKTWRQHVADIVANGFTPIVIAQNNKITAAVGIGDRLRPDAPELIASLKARGIQPALLSGDHPEIVANCAKTLQIDPTLTRGGVDPEQKRLFVEEIRKNNPDAHIVMVGDGVNDATALQAADVGIAVHGGTQAALVAADIFVTRQGVAPILELIDGTHHVMRTVHRNLTGSAIYNAAGISLAALGFVAPLVGAIAMPISSLFVIASSLAQKSFDNPYSKSMDSTPQPTSTPTVDIPNIS